MYLTGWAESPASTYVKNTVSALCYLCSLCSYVPRGKRHKDEQPLKARGTRRPHQCLWLALECVRMFALYHTAIKRIQFSPLTKPTKKLYCKLSALCTFCMHCTDYQYITNVQTTSFFVYTLSALVCTYLHLSARCMLLSAPPSLRTSAPNCSAVIPPAQFGIGETDF